MGTSNDERHSGHVDVGMDDPACRLCNPKGFDGGGDLIVDLLEAWQTHIAAEHDDDDLHPGCLPVETCLKGIAVRLSRAAAPDADLHRLSDALSCQWGISSPEKCAEIGGACAPCALRLYLTARSNRPTRPGSSRPCTR